VRVATPALAPGVAMTYLSIVALIPLAAVVFKAFENGADGFWSAVTNPQPWRRCASR
jgi:sulfate transport system permease protein